MSTKMVRDIIRDQFYIEITFPNNYKFNLWEGMIEHCTKKFSDNELKAIYDDCNNQLKQMNQKDVPFLFKAMLNDLRQVIIKRKIYE
jgi:hypothetical protein